MTDALLPPTESEITLVESEVRPHRRSRLRRASIVAGASALVLGGVVAGAHLTSADADTADAVALQSGTVTDTDTDTDAGSSSGLGSAPSLGDGALPPSSGTMPGGTMPGGTMPGGAPGSSGDTSLGDGTTTWPDADESATSTQEEATAASDAESTGVVLIDTELGYADGEAAGTGMILTSDGLVLTNNHVIEDSTSITVTDPSTGETYTATVLGTDAEDDVALLQLEGASGLTTVTLDDDGVVVGDTVTAVGNASGGGVLMAADGDLTAVDSSVTTSSEYTIEGETLTGMIEFSADVVSGDSGGALLDDEGEVIGMTTAASSGLATTIAYAVPIEDALAIVAQIQAGDESDGVVLGYPAFLGVGLASQTQLGFTPGTSTGASAGGVEIGYVYEGTPAADAGLEAGDVVTAVDGSAVTSGTELSDAIAAHDPGDSISLTWTDASGTSQSATVTLIAGPAA
ncbi:S1C family serine protease [Demequina subtropica]|uniref:S1C family serine protease n=1 Tax=Demequina subtropica TaxID=1638989 RepID=UPI00078631F6|nr:trypsin-like peptidase domain-containing protein [Demequina subtropica]